VELQKYYTPDWAVRGLFEFLPEIFPTFHTMVKIEPFAGDRAISRFFGEGNNVENDIDPGKNFPNKLDMRTSLAWDKLVGLTISQPRANKILITNPPFQDCQYFVRNALERFDNVVMMLRLSWLEPTLTRRDLPLPRHMLITDRS